MQLEITPEEYEQITCDIECAIDELDTLSREVSYYVTDLPDRLRTLLEIVGRAQ